MSNHKIEVVTLNKDQEITWDRDFDTIKEAKAWVKECGLSISYWDRSSESPGWAARNIDTIQLLKNNECIQDWFPKFAVPNPTQSQLDSAYEASLETFRAASRVFRELQNRYRAKQIETSEFLKGRAIYQKAYEASDVAETLYINETNRLAEIPVELTPEPSLF